MKDKLIIEICNFLGIDRETLVKSLNQDSLDKYIELWDDGNIMAIHNLGYELKG